jgi:hypothetical protein
MRPSLRALSASLLAATMGNEYLWRTGRSRRLQLAGQRTRGRDIGRGEWTGHCWRTDVATALAAGPVAKATVPAKSSWTRLH